MNSGLFAGSWSPTAVCVVSRLPDSTPTGDSTKAPLVVFVCVVESGASAATDFAFDPLPILKHPCLARRKTWLLPRWSKERRGVALAQRNTASLLSVLSRSRLVSRIAAWWKTREWFLPYET